MTVSRKRRLAVAWALGLGLLLLGVPTQTGALPLPGGACNSGQVTVPVTADAKVSKRHPNHRYGRRSDWKVNYGPATARSFVKFNLPTIPSGCSVDQATLELRGSESGSPHPAHKWPGANVNFDLATHKWIETGITWNNMPGGTGCVQGGAQDYASTRTWVIT